MSASTDNTVHLLAGVQVDTVKQGLLNAEKLDEIIKRLDAIESMLAQSITTKTPASRAQSAKAQIKTGDQQDDIKVETPPVPVKSRAKPRAAAKTGEEKISSGEKKYVNVLTFFASEAKKGNYSEFITPEEIEKVASSSSAIQKYLANKNSTNGPPMGKRDIKNDNELAAVAARLIWSKSSDEVQAIVRGHYKKSLEAVANTANSTKNEQLDFDTTDN